MNQLNIPNIIWDSIIHIFIPVKNIFLLNNVSLRVQIKVYSKESYDNGFFLYFSSIFNSIKNYKIFTQSPLDDYNTSSWHIEENIKYIVDVLRRWEKLPTLDEMEQGLQFVGRDLIGVAPEHSFPATVFKDIDNISQIVVN